MLRFLFTLINPALSATDAQRNPLLSVENSEDMVEFWKSFDKAKLGILKYRNTIVPFEVHVASFGGWGPFFDDTRGASEIIFDCRIGLMDLLITTLGNVEASTGEALKSIITDQSILMNDILGKLKSGYQRIHGQGIVAETIIDSKGYGELVDIEAKLLGNSKGEVASKHQELLKNHSYRLKYEILLIEKIAELFKENRKLQCEEWENYYSKVYEEQNDNLDKFLSQRKESNAVFLQEIRNEQVETK